MTNLNQISHMNRASLKGVHSTFEILKMAAISKWPPFLTITILPRFLGNGLTDLDQTSHMNRVSLKEVHSTFEIFKMAAISKWPPFLTINILHDYSELDGPISLKLHT